MVIGIGIDIIEIERIKNSIERFGNSFLNKIYTQNELDYCLAKNNKYQHLAARFAAKEAIYKALSPLIEENLGFKDACVEIEAGKITAFTLIRAVTARNAQILF